MAVERLLRAGFRVAIPVVDDGYDLLAFDDRRCWRLQVKSAGGGGCAHDRARVRITRGRRRGGRYSPEHVDAFIAVNVRTSVVMCVPTTEARGRWLRWSAAHRWSDMGVLRSIDHRR